MPHPSTFEQAAAVLYHRGPGRMVPDLSRITALTGLLGDPQLAYPTVHVTGTNGKGSTVRMAASLCNAAGISAGTYTSPHLQTVRERLTVAGQYITERQFAVIYDDVAPLADLVDEQARASHGDDADMVTFFELLTAMAFWWFADAPVDVGIIEVGMGGKWDATNVVRGDVAVLAPIDIDHRELGSTPAEVAVEKSGIIKAGSRVVSAAQPDDVAAVIDRAIDEVGATIWREGSDFAVVDHQVAVGGQLLTLRVGDRIIDDIVVPLYGGHQRSNAALALASFAALTESSFASMDDDVIRHGFAAVTVPGRLEVIHRDPTIIIDGAHNPHGARAAAAALDASFGFRDLILVVACLDDKDIDGIVSAYQPLASHVIAAAAPSERGASAQVMYDAALAVWGNTGVVIEQAADIKQACDMAQAVARPGDGILVTGSLYSAGAARDLYLPLVVSADDDAVIWQPDDEDTGDTGDTGDELIQPLPDYITDDELYSEDDA
ncbi:MAG: folylpolyglutamate synthase/dihydrofolate synthase family protein [Nitriliruptoraceae bacterium]